MTDEKDPVGSTAEILRALGHLQRLMSADASTNQVFARATEAIVEIAGAEGVAVFINEPDGRFVLCHSIGFPDRCTGAATLRPDYCGIEPATHAGKGLVLAADAIAPLLREIGNSCGEELPRELGGSLMVAPLLATVDGSIAGIVTAHHRESDAFGDRHLTLLEAVNTTVSRALLSARRQSQASERLSSAMLQLTSLQRVTTSIASQLDADQLARNVVDEVRPITGVDAAAMYVADEGTATIKRLAVSAMLPGRAPSFRYAGGITGQVIATGRHVAKHDLWAETDPRLEPLRKWSIANEIRAACWMPMTARGRVIGCLAVFKRTVHDFCREQLDLLTMFANQASIALDNARLYAEAQISLESQSALLAEMHHRVKNNLQTIAGLLSLQARHEPSAARALMESVSRIHSIAVIHQLLSSEKIGQASIVDIADQMSANVRRQFLSPDSSIEFRVDGDATLLDSGQATTLALTLNELLTNAVIHGFEGRDQGVLRITSRRSGDQVTIDIADNGRGMPPDFEERQHDRLGLNLIQTLVRTDLGGSVDIVPDGPGTTIKITFPVRLPEDDT